ncbi:MAG: AMP-binding protein [Acidimicrobiia bacterium]
MLVSDIVRRNAACFGDADAVVVPDGRTTTWVELEERTNRLGRALQALGLAKGDRLATFLPNGGEYVDFFFACAKTGIIGATLNVRLTAKDLVQYLSVVEPSAVLVHAGLADQVGWIAQVPSIRHVIGVGADHGFPLDLEELIAAQPSGDPGVAVDEDDVYQLGATSGTTGIPKAALLTHRNAVAAMVNWMADTPYPELGTNLQNIPLFFNPGGPAGLNPVMMKGGRTVIFPAFEPGSFLRAIPAYGVTHTILVPTMVGMVMAHPELGSVDVSTLMAIVLGGSPMPRELLAAAREVFGDIFFPQYGMAETYSSGATLRREDQFTEGTEAQVRRLASVGKPQALMQMRVVGDDGRDVPHDGTTPGEIWLAGDSLSPGYFRMPEETLAAREGRYIKTGDVATVDEEGVPTIVDRAKDIIIPGGINVFSRDIEEAFHEHPAVLPVAAIGIPHERWGEAIHAVVVLKDGATAAPEELQAFAAERLADYKKPRSVEVVDALPVGGTGKILKRELRAPYWEGREQAV